MMPADPLTDLIHATVELLGFELVDLRAAGPPRRRAVRIRIDRPDSRPGAGVTSDDCTRVARALREAFARAWTEDPVEMLEVSSPGIERPVRWPEHWRRFIGRRVRLRAPQLHGREEAEIVAVPDEAHVILRLADGAERRFALEEITEATLVVDWTQVR
jgi:ribosome maturation factor RimP